MAWLSSKYPESFDKHYRPRYEFWREQAAKGNRFYNKTLPMLCQTCQIPMLFTEPGDPTKICYREVDYKGDKYHFCSDHCKAIFEHEPEKYVQAWLPVQGLMQELKGDLGAWMDWVFLKDGQDNGDYATSQDRQNFEQWRTQATSNQ